MGRTERRRVVVALRALGLAIVVAVTSTTSVPSRAIADQDVPLGPTLVVVNDATNAPDDIDLPTVPPGTVSAAARGLDVVLPAGEAFAAGDEVSIRVGDLDGGDIWFAAVPDVTAGGQGPESVVLDDGGARLRVRIAGNAQMSGRLRIRRVVYRVGPRATRGPVVVAGTVGGLALDVTGTNAYVSDVQVVRLGPPTVAAAGTGGHVQLAPLRMSLPAVNSLAPPPVDLSLCVRTVDRRRFVAPGLVTISGSVALTGAPIIDSDGSVQFHLAVFGGEANASISGLIVPDGPPGLVEVTVEPCGGGAAFGPPLVLGSLTHVQRLAGSDRYETALRVAEATSGDVPTGVAILARSDGADALAASYLSRLVGGAYVAPILVTPGDRVLPSLANSLRRLGVADLLVVGGPAAIDDDVVSALDSMPAYEAGGTRPRQICPTEERVEGTCTVRVRRIFGSDRYATAAVIARYQAATPGSIDLVAADGLSQPLRTAFLARGDVAADALALTPLAVAGSGNRNGDGRPIPILLTVQNTLSAPAGEALRSLGIQQVIVVGGTQAISEAVLVEVARLGIRTVRVGGDTRHDTSAKLAFLATTPDVRGGFGFPVGANLGVGELVVVKGSDPVDAVAIGPYCGLNKAALLFTVDHDYLGSYGRAFLDATSRQFAKVTIVGGVAAINDEVSNAILASKTGTVI